MKPTPSHIRIFLLSVCLFTMMIRLHAQDKRITFQASPLYSYLNADFGKGVFYDCEGIKDPQPGFSGAIKFEADLNHRFALSTGLSYEMRRNSFHTTMYDTAANYQLLFPMPYYMTRTSSYHFVGVPIALQVNYINNAQWRIYHSFGTQFSFLVSSRYKGVEHWEENGIINYSRSGRSDDKNNVIVSFSSSIAICKYITNRMAFKIEPGISYMANHFSDTSFAKEKFMDLKIDAGIVYQLTKKDE